MKVLVFVYVDNFRIGGHTKGVQETTDVSFIANVADSLTWKIMLTLMKIFFLGFDGPQLNAYKIFYLRSHASLGRL